MDKSVIFECFRQAVIKECQRTGEELPDELNTPVEKYDNEDIQVMVDFAELIIEAYQKPLR